MVVNYHAQTTTSRRSHLHSPGLQYYRLDFHHYQKQHRCHQELSFKTNFSTTPTQLAQHHSKYFTTNQLRTY